MHAFPAESPELPSWILDAYNWAEDLVLESEPSSILPHRELTDGSCLADHLPTLLLRRLSAIWPKALGSLNVLKPWAAFLAIPLALSPTLPGVETQIAMRATHDSKRIFTLETGADVAALLDALPTALYVEQLEPVMHFGGEKRANRA